MVVPSLTRLRQWLIVGTLVALFALPAASQKGETWIEVQSPNFTIVSNASEKQARRIAEQFEDFRHTFSRLQPGARVDLGKPLVILAAKDEKTLRSLLPEFWAVKGRTHPAGIFLSGSEKLYAALRTDLYGDFPYRIVYHEYVHALVDLNFETVPLWLNEGLAEFFSHTILGDKEVGIGRPSNQHLTRLQREKLLPLETLFAVDRNSPHYSERNRASIFYAQSWALTHLLTFADIHSSDKRLSRYLEKLRNRVDGLQAAREAFGDLADLEKQLAIYVRQGQYPFIQGKASAGIDAASFRVRSVSPAEAAAVQGDFHARRNRTEEAQARLEEALRLNPNTALAHEAMGYLHLRRHDVAEAMRWFDRAAQLDSQSCTALYFSALMAMRSGADGATGAATEQKLLRALQLNPQFAPAHSTLAMLYASHDSTLEQALLHIRLAVKLEPGVAAHRINLANVLLRTGQFEEALETARAALDSAQSDSDRLNVLNLIQYAEQEQQAREARAESKRRGIAPSNTMVEGASGNPPRTLVLTGKTAAASGRVEQVSCDGVVLDLTLRQEEGRLRLLAPNYFRIDFTAYAGWDPPAEFQPCAHLGELTVKVSYQAADDADYAGQIYAVEILRPLPPATSFRRPRARRQWLSGLASPEFAAENSW